MYADGGVAAYGQFSSAYISPLAFTDASKAAANKPLLFEGKDLHIPCVKNNSPPGRMDLGIKTNSIAVNFLEELILDK